MLNLKISEYAKAGRTAYQAAIAQNTIATKKAIEIELDKIEKSGLKFDFTKALNHALMLANESKS